MDELIRQIKELMIEVSTGKSRIEDKNHEYQGLFASLDTEYKQQKIDNPNHFADSVEAADGSSLMKKTFSVNQPKIAFDDNSTETGRNIQQGYMELFSGAMIGIRNPKAHANITISRERAIHFLFLASLLMCKLDDAGV